MDVPISPALRRRRQARRWLAIVSAGVALAAATVGLARLHPAMPRVEKASLYFGTVPRGEMVPVGLGLNKLHLLGNERTVAAHLAHHLAAPGDVGGELGKWERP